MLVFGYWLATQPILPLSSRVGACDLPWRIRYEACVRFVKVSKNAIDAILGSNSVRTMMYLHRPHCRVHLIVIITDCVSLFFSSSLCFSGDPHSDKAAQGDAFKTLFVARVVSSSLQFLLSFFLYHVVNTSLHFSLLSCIRCAWSLIADVYTCN